MRYKRNLDLEAIIKLLELLNLRAVWRLKRISQFSRWLPKLNQQSISSNSNKKECSLTQLLQQRLQTPWTSTKPNSSQTKILSNNNKILHLNSRLPPLSGVRATSQQNRPLMKRPQLVKLFSKKCLLIHHISISSTPLDLAQPSTKISTKTQTPTTTREKTNNLISIIKQLIKDNRQPRMGKRSSQISLTMWDVIYRIQPLTTTRRSIITILTTTSLVIMESQLMRKSPNPRQLLKWCLEQGKNKVLSYPVGSAPQDQWAVITQDNSLETR